MKIRIEKVIDVSDWDKLVQKTYGRPYSFQQQDGCKSRGNFRFSIPSDDEEFDYPNNIIIEQVNGPQRGVSFAAWLARDPTKKLINPDDQDDFCLKLWWNRNFYPNFDMVAKDLYEKGLIEAGEYTIDIDW